MGPYQEFHDHGELRAEGVKLLYETVAAVARLRRFPPPEGHTRWGTEAVAETAHDFLVERDGVARLRQLHLRAADDESFERLLHQAIRNHLRSRARATDMGALMTRVRSIMEEDERFELVRVRTGIPRWTLASTGVQEQFTGQIEHLIRAGRAVEGIKEVRWRSERRRGPVAQRESLGDLFEAILQAAGTSLTVRELARVAAARFNLLEPPLLYEFDDSFSPFSSADLGPDDRLVVSEAALEIWDQLTDRERALYPYLDLSARKAAEMMGLGKSQMAVAQVRVRDLLARELEGNRDQRAILQELDTISESWRSQVSSE